MNDQNKHPKDADDVRGTAIGYAINIVMDYGSGRQVTISGTLPLGAPLSLFNRELDKLRKATNRQQAYVIMRDCEAKYRAESKLADAMQKMLNDYDSILEKEMARLKEAPESSSGTAGKLRTQVTAQIENMRSQAVNTRLQKQQDIDQHKTNAEIHEVTIASLQKEIDELSKDED